MSKQRVCVVGCLGKMGQVICRGLLASPDYELSAGIDVSRVGEDLGSVLQLGHLNVAITENLQSTLEKAKIDLAIDFTTPSVVVANVAQCIQEKVPVLVGTTGISDEDLEKLHMLAVNTNTPVLVVPNFAIGALLMMEFSKKAAKYMPNVEIIELHHPQKLDKPSGTAKRTRNIIMKALGKDPGETEAVPIHSVRLPGFVAHQEVIFAAVGQCLTIRHDSFQRESFMPGVLLGLKQLAHVKGLKVGLDL